jgi:hypothetical protein
MPTPPALDLSLPKGHPGYMPSEPWPNGPHGGPPLVPGAAPSEEQVAKDKAAWAIAAAEYLVKLNKWIEENSK